MRCILRCMCRVSNRRASIADERAGAVLIASDLDVADELVDDGVKEDTSNTDRAAKELHRVERLAEDDGDDDDDALGGVRDGLGDGRGLLDGEGGQLVVAV